jgi:hypothetical protein
MTPAGLLNFRYLENSLATLIVLSGLLPLALFVLDLKTSLIQGYLIQPLLPLVSIVLLLLLGIGLTRKWQIYQTWPATIPLYAVILKASHGLVAFVVSGILIIQFTASLSIFKIVQTQGDAPWEWLLFQNPFTIIAGLFFTVATLIAVGTLPGQKKRAQLTRGGGLMLASGMTATLFCGGWNAPSFILNLPLLNSLLPAQFIHGLVWLSKSLLLFILFCFFHHRFKLLSTEKMLTFYWKYALPIGLVSILGLVGWMMIFPNGNHFTEYFLTLIAGATMLYLIGSKIYTFGGRKQ